MNRNNNNRYKVKRFVQTCRGKEIRIFPCVGFFMQMRQVIHKKLKKVADKSNTTMTILIEKLIENL